MRAKQRMQKQKHTKVRRLSSLIEIFDILNPSKKERRERKITRNNLHLTETDRLDWIYKRDQYGIIQEVTCVSYAMHIDDDWVTVIYYDSFHGGLLHKHERVALDSPIDMVSRDQVKKRGAPAELLTWAMSDIRKRYTEYRRLFLKRNRDYLRSRSIELYRGLRLLVFRS